MMQVSSISEISEDMKPTVVTIGKFDALHLGHQQLISATIEIAEEHMLIPTLLTFDRHPEEILQNSAAPLPVIGPNQKRNLVAEAGIELMVSLTFDDTLANLSAQDFVQKVLVRSEEHTSELQSH